MPKQFTLSTSFSHWSLTRPAFKETPQQHIKTSSRCSCSEIEHQVTSECSHVNKFYPMQPCFIPPSSSTPTPTCFPLLPFSIQCGTSNDCKSLLPEARIIFPCSGVWDLILVTAMETMSSGRAGSWRGQATSCELPSLYRASQSLQSLQAVGDVLF